MVIRTKPFVINIGAKPESQRLEGLRVHLVQFLTGRGGKKQKQNLCHCRPSVCLHTSEDGELITLQNHTLPLNSPMICQWDERQKLKMIAACGYVTFLLKGRRGQSGNRSWASVVLSLGTPSSAQGHSGG